MLRSIFIGILFLTMFPVFVQAQEHKVSRLGVEDGLSSNYVVGIERDRQGFLWFATESGLNRFDGNRFVVYKKGEGQKSISANELNSIYADPNDDILWIGTQRQGLNALSYRTGNIVRYGKETNSESNLGSNDVTDISGAKNGGLWIATFSTGVKCFDKSTKKFKQYNKRTYPKISSDRVWSAREDNKGQLFIGHVDSGLTVLSLRTGQVKKFKNNPSDSKSLPGNSVKRVYVDKNNNVWLGTDNGLALYDPQNNNFLVFRHVVGRERSLLSNTVHDIAQLNDGRVAVATENGGLSILDINRPFISDITDIAIENITYSDENRGLSNSSVRSIFEDSFGNIWLGTYGGGINFLSHRKVLFDNWRYSSIQSKTDVLSNKVAWGITSDHANSIWIGTDGGGIDIFSNGKRRAVLNQASGKLNDNAILAAMCDRDNNLWFGTFQGGLHVFNSQSSSLLNFVIGDKKNDIRAIFQAADGKVWIGSTLGLYRYDKVERKGELFTKGRYGNSSYELDLIRAISQDKENQLWLGFFGQGIGVLDEKMNVLSRYNEDNGFPSNRVNHIYRDRTGMIWVATAEGLACFRNRETYTVFGEKNGLISQDVRAIAEDQQGNIWISTINGISRFDRKKEIFYHYDQRYGILPGDFMSGSVTTTTDGLIYFGSQNGVYSFDPLSIPLNTELSKTLITGVRALQSSSSVADSFIDVGIDGNTTLKHDQNTFSVSFHIQDYSLSPLVEYTYMLQGLDNAWHPSEDSEVTFRNIPHGKYKFLVRTRVVNQDWGKDIASLDIEIRPPFWLSWWAKAFYILMIGLLIFAIVKFYKRKLDLENSLLLANVNSKQEMELHDERIRFFTNITHELRTPLTLILGPLEDIQQTNDISTNVRAKIAVVHKSATRLMTLVSQILEFQKTESDSKQLFVKRGNLLQVIQDIAAKYKTYSTNTALSFEVIQETNEAVLYFDEQVLTTILENLLSNAFKYTAKGKVVLCIRQIKDQEKEYIEIEVRDTGKGIAKADLERIFDRYYQVESTRYVSGTGIGLALVKGLVSLHKAQISVESVEKKGSSFRVQLDMANTYPEAIHAAAELPSGESIIQEDLHNDARPIVLVVEDDYDIVDYIVAALSDTNIVFTANNGREGLEKAFTYIPDIIVSDVMMPELDGFEMAKALKADIRSSHIPLILLTAKDGVQYRQEGYNIGVDSYLTKPFSIGLLRSRIENLLRSRNRLAELFGKENVPSKELDAAAPLQQIDHEFLKKVQSIIEKSIAMDKIDVVFIAEKMSMSHSTLYRKIKGLSDKTPNEFIRLVRFNYAAELLRTGDYTVAEVSSRIGISSITYFRQCFKEQFGVSPTAYIKKTST
ncbi:hybrid sensor histidine kinase/response regulator transcription factor [Sphingobacterium sp. LRF_L2]|uniref:hybrid sensor histidine kinase/response regulator transcription factor n=1 Tax=Sphingobacterium sp. LRF_L2 TaxID=3369421 RepID=UPI003F601A77